MNKKSLLKTVGILTIVVFSVNLKSYAQLSIGADVVSSYVWRGVVFDNTPNIQPSLAYEAGGLVVGAWGSYNFTGTYQEPDIFIGYSTGPISITYTDYFAGTDDYFNFDNEVTGHTGEIMATYTVSDDVPFYIVASALVYGADKKVDDATKNNFSTYFELGYSFTVGEAGLDVFAGAVPTTSGFYGTDGFGLINLGLKGSREISITDNFALPINMGVITNLETEQMFFVFGFSL